jgi:outer membrane protein OmpA-like peptidoglycan-associated protein
MSLHIKKRVLWITTFCLAIVWMGIPEVVFSQNAPSLEQLPEWNIFWESEDRIQNTLGRSSSPNHSHQEKATFPLEKEETAAPSWERVQVVTFGVSAFNSSIVKLVDYRPWPKREPRSRVLADVYFDEDRNAIRGDAALAIQEIVALITKEERSGLHIEAHCDERETFAYSVVLGNRRAQRAAEFAKNLGLPQGKVTTVSFGPVKPQCRASHARCWEDNLRIQHAFHFLAIQSPRLGCVTRLRAISDHTDPLRHLILPAPFLQRIRLAEALPYP